MSESQLPGPGADVSGYHLVRELGRGGMGVVFVANRHNEDFALKFVLNQSKEDEARFYEEVKAMTLVGQHPNIVAIRDHFSHYQKLCIVGELVVGSDLATHIKNGRKWLWQDALELIETLADALAHIHDEGFLHRDVKPANVLIRDYDEHVFLTDFGLVGKGGQSDESGAPKLVGTAFYMSPEQMGGEQEAVGPHSDLWALGVILYELLTGQRPFSGKTQSELLGQIMTKNPLDSELCDPDWPPELKTLLESMLEKEPEARVQNAAKLAHNCRSLLNRVSKFPPPSMLPALAKSFALALIFLLPLISITAARWDDSPSGQVNTVQLQLRQLPKQEELLWNRLAKALYNQKVQPTPKLSLEKSQALREALRVTESKPTFEIEEGTWERARGWNGVFSALEEGRVLELSASFSPEEQRWIKLYQKSPKQLEQSRRSLQQKAQLHILERSFLIIDGVKNEDWSLVESYCDQKVYGEDWARERERWLTEHFCQRVLTKLRSSADFKMLIPEFEQLRTRESETFNPWDIWNRASTKTVLANYSEDRATTEFLARLFRLSVLFPTMKLPVLSVTQWESLAKVAGDNGLRPLEAALFTQASLTGPESRPPMRCQIKEYLLRLGYRKRDSLGRIRELIELLELGFLFTHHDIEDTLRKASEERIFEALKREKEESFAWSYLSGIAPLPATQISRSRAIQGRIDRLNGALAQPQSLPKALRGEMLFQRLRWQSQSGSSRSSKSEWVNRVPSISSDLAQCMKLGFISSKLEFLNFACTHLRGKERLRYYKQAVNEAKRDPLPQIRAFSFHSQRSPSRAVRWAFAKIQVIHFIKRNDVGSAKQVVKQDLQRTSSLTERLDLICFQTVVLAMDKQFVAASRNLSEKATELEEEDRGRLTKVFEEIITELEGSFSGQARKDLRGLLEVLKSRK